jgi:predicted nucleic acid-binding protein
MRFWDSSAIIPLIVREEQSKYCLRAYRADSDMLVWTMSKLEVLGALCRRMRDGALGPTSFDSAALRTNRLFESIYEVDAIQRVKERAMRLLRVHPLRAADALQLAAVMVGTEENVRRLPFMCFDDRLAAAARLEGYEVNP